MAINKCVYCGCVSSDGLCLCKEQMPSRETVMVDFATGLVTDCAEIRRLRAEVERLENSIKRAVEGER